MADAIAKPWYREFWFWFIAAPPLASVVLGLSLVVTAVQHGDSMVVGDYAKAGRSIHLDGRREQAAHQLGLAAHLSIDRDLGSVTVLLEGLEVPLDGLHLLLAHPTHAERDLRLDLQRDSTGLYRAEAGRSIVGRHYLRIESWERDWLLSGEINVDRDVVLTALTPSAPMR